MKLKRILAIVLCFAMVLSTMSFSVFAEDATATVSTYDELVAALANVEAEKTIELAGDITIDTSITVPDGVILDLKDNTLYVNVENSYYNNATIMNGDIVLGKDDVHVCDGYFLVNEGKTLVLNDVNMSSAADGIKGYAVFHLKTGANLDLIGSNFDIHDNEYSEGYIVYAGESTATVDITETTVTGTNVNGIVHATTVIDNSTFTIEDAVEHGINRSAVTIDDSTVTISGGTGRGITAQHGDLVISGNSVVNISNMGEATIELRNDKNLTVADTADVIVDVAVNNTTNGTITGDVTIEGDTPSQDPSATVVATVNGEEFTDIQKAIVAAAPAGTVELVDNVVVDKWIMFAETMSIGNGKLITLNINGLTIDGNNNTLTIKSIESAGNGNNLFYDAQNLNIKDMTIEYVDAAAEQGGIGLQSGIIENVDFVGGGYGILPGEGDITIKGCDFATNSTAIYYEAARDNLVVDGCEFTQPDNVNIILIRGNTTFTNNIVNSGRTVNVVSGSPVVTGNDFNDVRLKVYNVATANIEDNTINVLEFNDESEVKATFGENTLSADAEQALEEAGVIYVINDIDDLKWFRDDVNAGNAYEGKFVKLANDIDLTGENWTPIGDTKYNSQYAPVDASKVFSGVFDGNNKKISNLKIERILNDGKGADADANLGLFGIIGEGAVIKDLTITNVDINTDGRNVGALAGVAHKATLDNITVNGNIQITGGNNVCGVCAMTRYYDMSATDITVSGEEGSSINGNNIVGGIFAEIAPNGSEQIFENLSVENVAINGVGGVGGIVGLLTNGAISNVSVKDVELVGNTAWPAGGEDRIRIGSIVGLLGSTSATVSDVVTVENVTAKNLEGEDVVLPVVGANYDASSNATEAKIGDTYYATLTKAFSVAKSGDTVTLLCDIENVVEIPEGVTLDTNGYRFGDSLIGMGTEEAPYLISDIDELEFFRDSVNAGETTYNAPGVWVALDADIDMAGSVWTEGIGDGTNATFDGNFNGNNHIIKNFTMNPTPDADNYLCGGLFGYIYGNVQIKNLVFDNVTITSDATGHNVGVLVGFANNNGGKAEITNVTVKGDIAVDTPNTYGVGAIVGYSYRDMGTIADCAVEANDGSYINGYSFVGGITGYSYSNAVISGCSVKNIDITATKYSAGGIAGIVLSGNKISDCAVDSSVTVTGQANVGSVVGALATDIVDIEDCVAEEPVVGGNYSDNKEFKAIIGNRYFTSFEEAFEAAQNGDTVKLLKDISLDKILVNNKKITLDLGGKTITGTDNTEKNFSLIDNRGELTITGDGTMTLTATVNSGWNRYSAVLANNPGGKLIIENGTIEHLGGTDMAYGIDNLTNGKGTYAETIINGGTIKSTYRGIRQFLNGVEAQNILTVNGGTIEGANKSIWMQDPSTNANSGTLTVNDGATLNGDVYLFVTAGSTEWPVEVKIAASAVNGEVISANVPFGYEVNSINGYYGVNDITSSGYTITAVADKTEVRYNNDNTADRFTVKYIATGGNVIGAMAQFEYDTTLFTCDEDPGATGKIRMNSMTLTTDANGETLLKELHFKVKKNVEVDTTYEFIAKYVQVVSDYDAAGSGTQDGYVENLIGVDVTIIAQYDVTLDNEGAIAGNTYVDKNTDYTGTINEFDENKIYTITYTMGGEEYSIEVEDETFVIENVTGNIVFTGVTSMLNFELVLLPEAVTGYTLVLVKDGVSAGYTYDGVEMYAIDRYVGLTDIADDDDREVFVGGDILGAVSVRAMLVKGGVTLDEARAAIAVSANASDTLDISYDVNRNGAFWFNDAATAHGCYKDQYTLSENMTKLNWYLSSDVNTDFVVDTDDYDDTVAAFWATVEP